MLNPYLNHPPLDVLERFVLNRCNEQDLEFVESHILVCEDCVTIVQGLELETSVFKLALQQILEQATRRQERADTRLHILQAGFAWAGLGALAASVLLLISLVRTPITLSAERGSSAHSVLPAWHRATLMLIDDNLQDRNLRAEIVNESNHVIWTATVNSNNGNVQLYLPWITKTGHYYTRLYAMGADRRLLREFQFDVIFRF